jgi:hypothetical protein
MMSQEPEYQRSNKAGEAQHDALIVHVMKRID